MRKKFLHFQIPHSIDVSMAPLADADEKKETLRINTMEQNRVALLSG